MRPLLLAAVLGAAVPTSAQTELLGSTTGFAVSATQAATFDSPFNDGRAYTRVLSSEFVTGPAFLGVGAGWTGSQYGPQTAFVFTAGGYAQRDAERGSAALVSVSYQIAESARLVVPSVSISQRVTRAGRWELAPQGSVGLSVDVSRAGGGSDGGPFVSGGLALSVGTPSGRFVVAPTVTVLPTAEVGAVTVGVSGGLAVGL